MVVVSGLQTYRAKLIERNMADLRSLLYGSSFLVFGIVGKEEILLRPWVHIQVLS